MDKFTSIKYFCIAAETLNFRETANRLAISPSVITRVINELESELGEPLFKRNTRNIVLTSFGEKFLPKARQWLADSDSLFQSRLPTDEMAGVVRITVPAWVEMQDVLAELLTAIQPYPNLAIEWRDEMFKQDSVAGRIDIGFRVGLEPDPDFIVRHIGEFTEKLAASPKLLAELGEPKDLDDLCRRYPFALPLNANTGRAWDLVVNDNHVLIPQNIAFLSNSTLSGVTAVLQGRAVGLVSDVFCREYFKSGELKILLPETEIQSWKLFLYRPYQSVTTARVKRVFEILEGILKRRFGQD